MPPLCFLCLLPLSRDGSQSPVVSVYAPCVNTSGASTLYDLLEHEPLPPCLSPLTLCSLLCAVKLNLQIDVLVSLRPICVFLKVLFLWRELSFHSSTQFGLLFRRVFIVSLILSSPTPFFFPPGGGGSWVFLPPPLSLSFVSVFFASLFRGWGGNEIG